MTRFAGATPVPIALREENDFRMDVEELRSLVTSRTRLLILNSPHNPCGSVLTSADLQRHRRYRHRARPDRAGRRDLRPHGVRRGAPLHRRAARHGRAHDRARRVLQDVCHDRLAAGLRHPAAAPGARLQPPDHQQRELHQHLLAGRGGRGAHRATGRGRRDGRGVPGAAVARGRWPDRQSPASRAACRTARSTPSPTSRARA